MNNIAFEYPYLLVLLAPLLYCLYKCRFYATPKIFVHLHFFSNKKSFKNLDMILKVLIFVFLSIALASPIFVDKKNPLNREGRDIVLALDASGSMNSSGFTKKSDSFDMQDKTIDQRRLSRFDITKYIATEFIKNRLSDNVGIVIFGDFAFIASPITYEKEIVSDMLSYINNGIAGQNTAIGEAIAMSVRAFKHSGSKSKIVVLLTDGEHNSGSISPKDATVLAKQENIKIYTIGIGEKGEADEALLREMANESGGEFFSATSGEELEKVYGKIDALESSKIKSKEYKLKDYYYWVFLLLALGILFYLIFREVKK